MNAVVKGKRRPSKNVLMFFLSLIIGGVGVFYSKQYIEEQIAVYKSSLEKTEKMVEVVVPVRDMSRGEIVKQSDLSVRKIPEQYIDSNSITAATYETAVGQRVEFAVQGGKPMLWAHLEGGQSPTFSGKVPTGLRAMTIRVDEINSISGFLHQAAIYHHHYSGNAGAGATHHLVATGWESHSHAAESGR